MKKYLRILCFALTLVLILPAVFGCFNFGNETETQVEESAEETEAGCALFINGVALADYTIVYSRKSESGGEKAATYLNQKLEELYGTTLPLEFKSQDRYEIVIGSDGGDQSIANIYKDNGTGILGANDKKIIMMGANYSVLRQAIDLLLSKVTGDDAKQEILVSGHELIDVKVDSINVMTYNILFDMEKIGRPDDAREKMVETVLENDVDVLGTQEDGTDHSNFFVENLKSYDVYTGDGTEGNFIYWKKDKFNVVKKSFFYLSNTPGVPSKFAGSDDNRTMVYVILEVKETGKQFIFVNVHVDYQAKENVKKQQLEVLGSLINKINKEALPVVLLGDFNTTTTKSGGALTDFMSNYPEFGMTFKVANKKGDAKGTLVVVGSEGENLEEENFTQRDTDTMIDYIFVTTDSIITQYVTVVDNIKDGKYPSDHLPVLAKVDIY